MPCGLSKVITRRRLCRLSNANARQQRANREEAEGGLSGRLPFLFLLKPGKAGLPYYITVGRQADTFWAEPFLWLHFGFAENCVAARFSNFVS
ncbi:hypothetical protein [Levyella massiliensis]|uniref:hypothetical protein n=1 Tax=Levyella massiliensis TaxID=938289 RepID=UPI0003672871|nr:hypothetical protein [Levyella massiliensis]